MFLGEFQQVSIILKIPVFSLQNEKFKNLYIGTLSTLDVPPLKMKQAAERSTTTTIAPQEQEEAERCNTNDNPYTTMTAGIYLSVVRR